MEFDLIKEISKAQKGLNKKQEIYIDLKTKIWEQKETENLFLMQKMKTQI